ncbi:MAG TPA: hypothetical protein VGM81_05350 [Burkholderiaceae bacterium]|jgi:hypothetical protein
MARSFDDLARRICVATATLSGGKDYQWTSVVKVATLLQITNEEIIRGAIQYAGQKAWLKVVGNPAQSVLLNPAGKKIAEAKRWAPRTAARLDRTLVKSAPSKAHAKIRK